MSAASVLMLVPRRRSWYLKAANAGDDTAALWMGDAFSGGLGVNKDEFQATAWYLQAAKLGNAAVRRTLRERLEKGIGANQDIAAAAKWYLVDAEKGQTEAQLWLADQFQGELTGAPDQGAALHWYLAAAETMHESWLSLEIAQRYEQGIGTRADIAQASIGYRRLTIERIIRSGAWMAFA